MGQGQLLARAGEVLGRVRAPRLRPQTVKLGDRLESHHLRPAQVVVHDGPGHREQIGARLADVRNAIQSRQPGVTLLHDVIRIRSRQRQPLAQPAPERRLMGQDLFRQPHRPVRRQRWAPTAGGH